MLLEAAADQNLEDNRGLTVFQLAAEHVAIVQMLARAKKKESYASKQHPHQICVLKVILSAQALP